MKRVENWSRLDLGGENRPFQGRGGDGTQKSAMPPKSTQKKGSKRGKKGRARAPKKSGQKDLLSNLAADIIGSVLGFFRSVQHEGSDVFPDPDYHLLWDDVTFLEDAATLANVLNFAACSRATRDVALGDGVWAPHAAAMEANLVVAPREYEDYDDTGTRVTRVLPEELVDPRALDPRGYASLSARERYYAVRGFFDGLKKAMDELGDETRWSAADILHLTRLADFCATRVEDALEDDYWAGNDGGLDDDEIEEVLERITPSECAHLTLKCFVLPELARGGVSGHPRDILLGGWPNCDPCSRSARSTTKFLCFVTGIAWDYVEACVAGTPIVWGPLLWGPINSTY